MRQFQSITLESTTQNPETDLTEEEANHFMLVLEPLVTGDPDFALPEDSTKVFLGV